MTERMTTNYHLCMTPTEKRMLDQLSTRSGIAKSVLIRDAIRSYYTMSIGLSPVCANGRQCVCAQLNPVAPLPDLTEIALRTQTQLNEAAGQ